MMDATMGSQSTLVFYKDTATFTTEITRNVEQYLLDQQRRYGRKLVAWELDDKGREFTFLFDQLLIDGEEMLATLKNIQVMPWHIAVFFEGKRRPPVRTGTRFTTLRLTTDYADVLSPGDPAQLYHVPDCEIVGDCTVLSVKRIRIKDLTNRDLRLYRILQGKRNREGVAKWLSTYYEQRVSLDDQVAVIELRADSNIGDPPTGNLANRFFNWFLGEHWRIVSQIGKNTVAIAFIVTAASVTVTSVT